MLCLPQCQTDGSAAHFGIPVSEATMAFFPGPTVGLFTGSYMLSTGLQYISVICSFFFFAEGFTFTGSNRVSNIC